MKPIRVFDRIIKRRVVIFGLLFVLVAGSFAWFGWNKLSRRAKAGITISASGQQVTFGSGYYSVDSFGKVYDKAGSPIAGTADALYPYVSYLSSPYLVSGIQLDLTGKDVVVASGAMVLMEGSLSFNSLDVQTGGTISQPQPDREGYINRYQYSDQEWALVFYGFLKVDNGQKRKLVCPSNYYVNDSDTLGNGCSISYSPTYDGSTGIFDLANWTSFDQVWQTGASSFNVARYTDPGANYINNATGSTQYYPIRLKFKNDNRDNRLEPEKAILRDDANALLGSADGVDETLIFGIGAGGAADLAKQSQMTMQYYLANQYLPTPASPNLGWISEDFSNAYRSYSADDIDLTSFFNGYGEHTNGIFDLEFDDRNAYNSTVASTPFAKGTSGAVYDQEVYKTYTSSAKTINPAMSKGPASRYIPAGLSINVQNGEVKFSGGTIDLSGKGYAGYNLELRTENDDASLLTVRGGGYPNPPISGTSGGMSSNNIPGSAAHADPSGIGGGGRDKNSVDIAQNSNVYDQKTTAATLGSGGGGASQGAAIPSRGGNGGGYIFIRAQTLRFTTKVGGIKANGTDGLQIASGWSGSSGGSGGTIAIAAAKVYYPTTDASTFYFDSSGGKGFQANTTTFYSSGAGGGYVRLAFSEFNINGRVTTSKDKVVNSINIAGGSSGTDEKLYGDKGQYWIDFSPAVNMSFPAESKKVTITRGGGSAAPYQVLPNDTVNVDLSVSGLTDITARSPVPADVVLVMDTSGSMDFNITSGGVTKKRIDWLKEAAGKLLESAAKINDGTDQINLGVVNFNGTKDSDFNLPGHYFGCEANESNPAGIACSSSYSGNYMTTDPKIFTNQYKKFVEGLTPLDGTPAGAGLNNAINHLLDGTYSRVGARKYIIFVTDGEENLPTCITGPVDRDRMAVPSVCDESILNFNSSGKAITGYPLDRIKKNNIGLISIGTILGSTTYGSYLQRISDYARPSFFKDQNYYGVDDIGTLGDAFVSTLDSIANTPTASRIEVSETLPPGVELVGSPPPMTIFGDRTGKKIPVVATTDPDGRITLRWIISPDDYDLRSNLDFDQQKFITTIHFKPGHVPSGNFYDVDQNKDCPSENASDAFPFINGRINSFANYQPVGNYNAVNENPVPFPTVCQQYFSNSITGDVYGAADILGFAQLGKHLYQYGGSKTGEPSAFYKMSNYEFNPNAQSYWKPKDGKNRNRAMTDAVNRLKGDAKDLKGIVVSGNIWSPPIFNGVCGITSGSICTTEENQYPNGRVWLAAPTGPGLLIPSRLINYKYNHKSTIIIDSGNNDRKDVQINADFEKYDSNSSIGFIVTNGDVIIQNKTNRKIKIEGSFFVPNGNIIISGNNIDLVGSFVAKDFLVSGSGNINFVEDTRAETTWPPGFRDVRQLMLQNN